ncbi:MAG: hypothetical protein OHK0023_28410 [Anaerolineae bacterium]
MKQLFWLVAFTLMISTVTPPVSAQRPDAPKYAERGSYAVGAEEIILQEGSNDRRVLRGIIWYPALPNTGGSVLEYPRRGAGIARRSAIPEASGGPFPLIIFSHGFGGHFTQASFLTEHLATHGFVVISVNHSGTAFEDLNWIGANSVLTSLADRPNDVLKSIRFAERLTAAGSGSALSGLIDTNRIGVTGHSFGGYTAFASAGARIDFRSLDAYCESDEALEQEPNLACSFRGSRDALALVYNLIQPDNEPLPPISDPRIKSVVALAPFNTPAFGKHGLAALNVPTLIMVGSADSVAKPERDAYIAYEQTGSADKALAVLEGAEHAIFVDVCGEAVILQDGCFDPVWDKPRAHDLTNHFATAWFLATLKADSDARAVLKQAQVDFIGVRYLSTIH